MTTLLSRPSSDLAIQHASRAAQRKQRLIEIEYEMRLEEAEALKMTEVRVAVLSCARETEPLTQRTPLQEQRQILIRSFTSVKVEFSDLDGLARTTRAKPLPCLSASASASPSDHAFVILSSADLASFAPHETIRARPPPRTTKSSPNLSHSSPAPSPVLRHAQTTTTTSSSTIKALLSRKTPRSRSPIKGLFPTTAADPYESDSERTVRGSEDEGDDEDASPRPKKERKRSASGRGRAASGSGSPRIPTSTSTSPSLGGSAAPQSRTAAVRAAMLSAALLSNKMKRRSKQPQTAQSSQPAPGTATTRPTHISYLPSPAPAPTPPSSTAGQAPLSWTPSVPFPTQEQEPAAIPAALVGSNEGVGDSLAA
ncbi:hypothetical protein H0H81_011013 [Sphagnurus paluster]|uniref:Uncharacterized protein n=1 Tax=Sphagnurus paluster TaxID=117069 RepID=A0A9P7GPS6_9AGAR|nr:hypothetical protein H0H81_011013 [Sphagnurus paluster]